MNSAWRTNIAYRKSCEDRFHIVVFNFERITSFLANFSSIKNFDPKQDKIYVFDCSRNHKEQKTMLCEFALERGWNLGEHVHYLRRRNWGIDQGGRIDYFNYLQNVISRPKYIWQFQEHYLDLTSEWSKWPDHLPSIGGQLKGDTIPDQVQIDLDLCEEIYEQRANISVIYADRQKIGIFTHRDGQRSFYVDGANFSIRTADVLRVFKPELLDCYRMIYDGSYQWALFVEMEIGSQLSREGSYWYDLVTHNVFDSPQSLENIEATNNLCLHQIAEDFYAPLYASYNAKCVSAKKMNPRLRQLAILGGNCFRDVRRMTANQIRRVF